MPIGLLPACHADKEEVRESKTASFDTAYKEIRCAYHLLGRATGADSRWGDNWVGLPTDASRFERGGKTYPVFFPIPGRFGRRSYLAGRRYRVSYPSPRLPCPWSCPICIERNPCSRDTIIRIYRFQIHYTAYECSTMLIFSVAS